MLGGYNLCASLVARAAAQAAKRAQLRQGLPTRGGNAGRSTSSRGGQADDDDDDGSSAVRQRQREDDKMKMRKRDGNRQSRADTFAQHNVYKQTELSLYDGVGAAAAAAVDASVGGVVVVVVIAGSQRQPSCVLFAHARVCVSV